MLKPLQEKQIKSMEKIPDTIQLGKSIMEIYEASSDNRNVVHRSTIASFKRTQKGIARKFASKVMRATPCSMIRRLGCDIMEE